ncbi:MAG: primosomal protein N', partial [Bdellovibrionales bacterium]|nr:primosomal protein N' [Bdellovibrionales bacterium]
SQRSRSAITKGDSQLSLLSSGKPERSARSGLKAISSSFPAFTSEQLRLFEWMASYYGCELVDVIENAVPRVNRGRSLLQACLNEAGSKLLADPEQLAALERRASRQADFLRRLHEAGGALPVGEISAHAHSIARRLEQLGLISLQLEHAPVQLVSGDQEARLEAPALTAHQQRAVESLAEAIQTGGFQPFLLFGVTGSGKTEVYLRAIERVLEAGGSALVVVPEIALTPQLVDRFVERLQHPLAILHSQVGQSERWQAWEAVLRGECRVVIGARSAIFAPLNNLALIIVDEEHESSYKQSEGLRYHARDVAIMRAQFADCPIVLGSATPSFESLMNVKRKRFTLLEMPERVSERPMPTMNIVDLSKIRVKEMPSANISPELHRALGETLDKKQQAIILYNRRGFSSYLQCDSCGEVVSCPDCSVALTYHKRKNIMLCHYCDRTSAPPEWCAFCRDDRTTRVEDRDPEEVTVGKLHHRGGGTERVVEELGQLFPDARIARMDRDTVGQKGAYRRILDAVRSFDTDILVGTQMLAKGHDLPGVTLVGIIDADVGLHLPDFRASEKIFQLITQASGRAGRGTEPGTVVIQTRQPNHPTIVASVRSRFKAFARFELDQREGLAYPPWGRLLRIVVSDPGLDQAFSLAKDVRLILERFVEAHGLADQLGGVLGPAPAPIERLRGRYRWHLLVKSPSKRVISQLAHHVHAFRRTLKEADTRIAVDVDPIDML